MEVKQCWFWMNNVSDITEADITVRNFYWNILGESVKKDPR